MAATGRDAVLNRNMFAGPQSQQLLAQQPLPPDQMVAAAGADMEQQASAAGSNMMEQMMAALESAQDPLSAIQAIRQRQGPIELFRDELSQIVGDDDALDTPDSVLALVQPTLMMMDPDPEGGLASMLGAFVEDAEMVGEMGGGIAGQLAQQQEGGQLPQQQPVQRFRAGGEVTSLPTGIQSVFDHASESRSAVTTVGDLKSYYEKALPTVKEVLGDDEGFRRQAKANIFLDIAKSGLALASGKNPTTGENMAGGSFASQLAQAAMPVMDSIKDTSNKVYDRDQKLRGVAFDMAGSDRSAALSTQAAQAKDARRAEREAMNLYIKEELKKATAAGDHERAKELLKLEHQYKLSEDRAKATLDSAGGLGDGLPKSEFGWIVRTVNNPEIQALARKGEAPIAALTALDNALLRKQMYDSTTDTYYITRNVALPPETMMAFYEGGYLDRHPEEKRMVEEYRNAYAAATTPEEQAAAGRILDAPVSTRPGNSRPGPVTSDNAEETPAPPTGPTQGPKSTAFGPTPISATDLSTMTVDEIVAAQTSAFSPDADLMFGTRAVIPIAGDRIGSAVAGLFGIDIDKGVTGESVAKNRAALQSVNQNTLAMLTALQFDARTGIDVRNMIRETLPEVGGIFFDEQDAEAKLEPLLSSLYLLMNYNKDLLDTSGRLTAKERTDIEASLPKLAYSIASYEGLQKSLSGRSESDKRAIAQNSQRVLDRYTAGGTVEVDENIVRGLESLEDEE